MGRVLERGVHVQVHDEMEAMAHLQAREKCTFGREDTRKWAKQKQEEERKRKAEEKERERREKERRKRRKIEERRAMEHRKQMEWMCHVMDAPTLRPTWEEFQDPIHFLREAHAKHGAAGVCKIIPPVQATVPAAQVLLEKQQKLPAKVQQLPPIAVDKTQYKKQSNEYQCSVPNSAAQADGKVEPPRFQSSKNVYTLAEFERAAWAVSNRRLGTGACGTSAYIEAEYWSTLEGEKKVQVEYAGDVEGTGFSDCPDDPLASSPWNLNKIPKLNYSLLHLLNGEIPGVTKPMLYVGMLFSTFAWHVEDHYLYSINYHHMGAPKTWYGVGAGHAEAFDSLVQAKIYKEAKDKDHASGGLMEKTTMFSPKLLLDRGIPVYRIIQQPGEFVVTFPRAYHGGFSQGFNIGEAVNFATSDWLPYGSNACRQYASVRRLPVLPQEEMVFHAAQRLWEQDHKAQSTGGCTLTSQPSGMHASLDTVLRATFRQEVCRMLSSVDKLQATGASVQIMDKQSRSLLCSRCLSLCYYGIVLCRCQIEPICMADAVAADCKCGNERTLYIHKNFVRAVTMAQGFTAQIPVPTSAVFENLYLDGSFYYQVDDISCLETDDGKHFGGIWDNMLAKLNKSCAATASETTEFQRGAFEHLLSCGITLEAAVSEENKGVNVPRFSAQCKVCMLHPRTTYGSLEFCSEDCAKSFYTSSIQHKESSFEAPVTPTNLSGTSSVELAQIQEYFGNTHEGLDRTGPHSGCSNYEREGTDRDGGTAGDTGPSDSMQNLVPLPSGMGTLDVGKDIDAAMLKRARNSYSHLQRCTYAGVLSVKCPDWTKKDASLDLSLRLYRAPCGALVLLGSELQELLGVTGRSAMGAFLREKLSDDLPALANCIGVGEVRRGAWVFTREDCRRLSQVLDDGLASFFTQLSHMDWSVGLQT